MAFRAASWLSQILSPNSHATVFAEHELGGILADDMGLGKSVQTLAHLLREKELGRLAAPALLVVPTSLVYNLA